MIGYIYFVTGDPQIIKPIVDTFGLGGARCGIDFDGEIYIPFVVTETGRPGCYEVQIQQSKESHVPTRYQRAPETGGELVLYLGTAIMTAGLFVPAAQYLYGFLPPGFAS